MHSYLLYWQYGLLANFNRGLLSIYRPDRILVTFLVTHWKNRPRSHMILLYTSYLQNHCASAPPRGHLLALRLTRHRSGFRFPDERRAVVVLCNHWGRSQNMPFCFVFHTHKTAISRPLFDSQQTRHLVSFCGHPYKKTLRRESFYMGDHWESNPDKRYHKPLP